jgi:hypothetical protein
MLSLILIAGAQQLLNLGGQLATLHEWSDIPLRGRSLPWTAADARVKDHALADTLGDAGLDRILHNSYHLNLAGESRRKPRSATPISSA